MKSIFSSDIYRKAFSDDWRIVFSETPFVKYFVTSYYDGIIDAFVITRGGDVLSVRNVWWDDSQDNRLFSIKSFNSRDSGRIQNIINSFAFDHLDTGTGVFVLTDIETSKLRDFEDCSLSSDYYLVLCKNISDSCITMHYALEE